MVRKGLLPDVDLPTPRQPVMGVFSAMTPATGGSAPQVGMLLSPVPGTAQQRRKQRDEGALLMLTLSPLPCAESVYFDDPDEAESVLLAIAELSIPLGTSTQPVASYLAGPMSACIFSSRLSLYVPLLYAPCHGGLPSIRLTGLSASMESLEITGKRLSNLALDRSFELELELDLDPEKLVVDTRRREAIAVNWLHFSLYDSNILCIIRRYMFDDEPVKEYETKQVLAKQHGGEEEVISISREENTEKGKYEPPKVWLTKENMENKKRKPEAHFFSALKVTEIQKSTRYLLLLVLFCTLITVVDSSSKGESSPKVLCSTSDATSVLFPRYALVCPKVDISTIHLTHSKSGVPPTSPASSPQEREESCPGRCVILVLVVSLVSCVGPWFSINSLEPNQGKVHKFLFFIRIEPVRMWYLTLAVSINYYVSMISSGVMLESNQRCAILVPNTISCFIFLLLVAYLFYREKTVFQVTNAVSVVTSFCCFFGAILIGLLHTVCGMRHPYHLNEIFYFEKIALACLIVMHVFRWFTMEHSPLNFIVNILATLIALSLLCTGATNKWHRIITLCSAGGRIVQLVTWTIWCKLGRHQFIVIEPVNAP